MSCSRYRRRACLVALTVCAAGGGPDNAALAEEAGELLATVTVIGQRDELLRVTVDPAKLSITQPTTGALLSSPSAAVIRTCTGPSSCSPTSKHRSLSSKTKALDVPSGEASTGSCCSRTYRSAPGS